MKKASWIGATVAALGLGIALPASAYTVQQDGLGMWVFATQNGQTVNFRVEAEFATTASTWLGTTMDSFSLQFGNVGKGGNITAYSANPTSTNTTGTWTGFLDKVSGTGCGVDTADAICYSVLPTATGGDGASIIAALPTAYFWEFSVTFASTFDVAAMLAESNSIKFLSVKQNPNGGWSTGNQLSQSGTFDDCCEKDVPEPGTLALLGLGLLGLGASRRRKLLGG